MTYKAALSFADGKTLFCTVQGNEILLDAALRAGIRIPLDCREGVCATCQGRCESGQYTQDYVDDEALSASDLAQRRILTCQTRLQSDAAFYFDFDSSRCHDQPPERLSGVVTAVEQVSPTTAVLHVDASACSTQIDYLPGQYARLLVPGSGQWRAYSFASAPNAQNRLQFLIRLLPEGLMSDYIRQHCAPGQRLAFEAPLGTFYLRQISRPLVLVAGGTGLSAFLGMLDQIALQGGCGQPLQLFYGVTHERDLCEVERLQAYGERIEGLQVNLVVSQPSSQWQGRRGWIPEHFDAQAMAAAPFDMYVCGPPPMVEAIRQWIDEQGLQHCTLYVEKFAQSSSPAAQ